MFDSIFLAIETWMRGMLTSMVDTNLAGWTYAARVERQHLQHDP